ncbi:hypothetical protein [Wenjunlia tyrosinilytica]|uniref:Secreted protein n=1 Tax=Wenjunlia tyrosinilytica TaxID=1544741 RepID=A0A917ZDW7_9ACTN|nr:hypothetical protein [Wenjunlia tyrosinilytica]GGO81016.1 hypothetical protein GCM10012280_04290 [Wenjunlia tyrosinilytica]
MGGPTAVLPAPGPQAPAGPPGAAGPPRSPRPPRRPAYQDGLDRFKDAATTEPGRLRIIGAALVVLVLVFGAMTAWQVMDRASSARDVVERSQPLTANAADIYRYLADADATAASGFLAGGQEPKRIRDRYNDDIRRASGLLAEAAANSEGSGTGRRQIAQLNRDLPVYTGLVASARANNRQGLPLGGAYLRYASEKMRTRLLPAAEKLYTAESDRLAADYDAAEALPWAATGLGVVALGGLLWAQRRMFRRTKRVFNVGLLGATAALATVLVWLVVGHTLARGGLTESNDHGAKSLQVLSEARITALKARGDEGLTLVARGSGAVYEETYKADMRQLSSGGSDLRDGALLERALLLADDTSGSGPVNLAIGDVRTWKSVHAQARRSDDSGSYDEAVAYVIGGKDRDGKPVRQPTATVFDALDRNLSLAARQEQAEFEKAANDGRDALGGLAVGAGVLAVLASAAVVLGIGRRLSEYR